MDKTIGVLGGGQLGRMLAEAANRLNIKVITLDKGSSGPTKQIVAHGEHIDGSFKDPVAIKALAEKCDVLTIEIEHVDAAILKQLENQITIEPKPETIAIIQDKYVQKEHLKKFRIPVADSVALRSNDDDAFTAVVGKFGLPFMLKSRKDAYDGRGNAVIKNWDDYQQATKDFGDRALYAERWARFKAELSVVAVKTKNGALAFPVVETVHERSICKLTYAPPRNVSKSVRDKAEELARDAVGTFKGKGIFAVEMFLLENDELLVNEIAPRPHNSGHWTIEGCGISQFEAHIHAILDLPIPLSRLRLREPSIMLNILGGKEPTFHLKLVEAAFSHDGTVHLYGKGTGTPGRKMGHITITAPTLSEAEQRMAPLLKIYDEIVGNSKSTTSPKIAPLVGVIMGSDSDLPAMQAGILILEKLEIPHEVRITSAHRTPAFMSSYANTAADRGIKVIIGAAGGAAHLPGMVASQTSLPVIGVPIKASVLDGVDSLYSIVQMPRGVPVATVGIGNSTNAALLAARILGASDERIRGRVDEFAEEHREESLGKDGRLQELGTKEYLETVLKK